MSVLHDIAAAATTVVEAPAGSGLEWRLRKVSSRHVHEARAATLAMLPTRASDLRRMASALSGLRERVADGGEELGLDELLATLDDGGAEVMAQALAAQQAGAGKAAERQQAMVAAAVVAVRHEGGEWSNCKVILDGSTDADAGVLSIHDLPPGAEEVLAGAALMVATDGGAALERLAGFRRAP